MEPRMKGRQNQQEGKEQLPLQRKLVRSCLEDFEEDGGDEGQRIVGRRSLDPWEQTNKYFFFSK